MAKQIIMSSKLLCSFLVFTECCRETFLRDWARCEAESVKYCVFVFFLIFIIQHKYCIFSAPYNIVICGLSCCTRFFSHYLINGAINIYIYIYMERKMQVLIFATTLKHLILSITKQDIIIYTVCM